LIDETALSRRFSDLLGVPLRLVAASLPLPESALSPAERALLAGFTSPVRRASWLRGRAALRRLGLAPGEPSSFPPPDCSLTHSGDWAVAVGLPPGRAAGLGVDLELHRAPRVEAARKFMDARELGWLGALETGDRAAFLRCCWTAKEACFKADPGNSGRTVADYAIQERPGERVGVLGPGIAFTCAGTDVGPGGRLAVAVAPLPGAR
jgi:hypothetical protein